MFKGADSYSLSADATDAELMHAIGQGDTHALETLYSRHGAALLGYLSGQLGNNRQLAEEVLQDVMMAVWRSAAKFRGESKVRTWLISIARNQAINLRRKNRLETVELLDEVYTDDSTEPLEAMMRQTQAKVLHEALLLLPEPQRETLELVFFHQLSGTEAAEVMGVSVGTVKSRLHRAKETLRRLLGDEVNFS